MQGFLVPTPAQPGAGLIPAPAQPSQAQFIELRRSHSQKCETLLPGSTRSKHDRLLPSLSPFFLFLLNARLTQRIRPRLGTIVLLGGSSSSSSTVTLCHLLLSQQQELSDSPHSLNHLLADIDNDANHRHRPSNVATSSTIFRSHTRGRRHWHWHLFISVRQPTISEQRVSYHFDSHPHFDSDFDFDFDLLPPTRTHTLALAQHSITHPPTRPHNTAQPPS